MTPIRLLPIALILLPALPVIADDNPDPSRYWRHPICATLPEPVKGYVFTRSDGTMIRIFSNATRTARGDWDAIASGRVPWSEPRTMYEGGPPGIPEVDTAAQTNNGNFVVVYRDVSTRHFGWDPDWEWAPDLEIEWRQDAWAIRSADGGETWDHRQPIYHGSFVGWLRETLVTRRNVVVVSVSEWRKPDHRFVTRTYTSTDEGRTWQKSNAIDLGGRGNHDGAIEATLTELSDGRLYMLIRTNLDRLWEAYSEDEGRTWLTIRPSIFDASSSPAFIRRLKSGRHVMVWNRLYPEGLSEQEKASYPRRAGNNGVTQRPSNWQRNELSIVVSDDDCRTWTKPFVLLRDRKGEVVYQVIAEVKPGLIQIVGKTHDYLHVMIREEDLLRVARPR